MYPYAEYYHSKSYNILRPDDRAHGLSGGELIEMGNLDSYDINYWIDYICNINKDNKIILHGVSMKTAEIIIAVASKIQDNVKYIIEDCSYTSVKDYLTLKIR